MRVLVVDDSAFMRQAITKMLDSDPGIEVVGSARNGKEGLELAGKLRPDVMTMDIEMPVMDGLTALRRIMSECPTRVLMLSSLTTEGSHAALTALKMGAADVLAKDQSQVSLGITKLKEDLLRRVRALARSPIVRRSASPAAGERPGSVPSFRPGQFDVICIGSSTGGPPVVEKILGALPANMSAPLVVAQHMPEVFTKSLAERLDKVCALRVVHAEDNMPLEQRTVYIAPGGRNLHLSKVGLARWRMVVNDLPAESLYRPSADALLLSAAKNMGKRALAVILTGIGSDGLEGAKPLREKGGVILAQNEETCVVYGMPKAVTENGLVAASLAPGQIGRALATLGTSGAASRSA